MDNSTENVTLIAAFVSDVIKQYEGKPGFHGKLSEMASGYDLSNPMNQVPMEVYNSMCNWIESQIGKMNTRKLGRQIGNTAYQSMIQFGIIKEGSTPQQIMEGLVKVAASTIQDPKKRGWVIVETGTKKIIMRRTQTFNSTLQLGLLDELIKKAGVLGSLVDYHKSVEKGDEFDEYVITWL